MLLKAIVVEKWYPSIEKGVITGAHVVMAMGQKRGPGRPRGTPMEKYVVRLPQGVAEQVERIAQREAAPTATVLRRLIVEHLAEQDHKREHEDELPAEIQVALLRQYSTALTQAQQVERDAWDKIAAESLKDLWPHEPDS